MKSIKLNEALHSFVIPYHSNFELLEKSLELLINTLPSDIRKEILIIANNKNRIETDITVNVPDCRVIRVNEDLLYARAVNLGVSQCKGDVVTLCDEDLFYLPTWYEPIFEKFISSKIIGAVSCKLLNPNDNTILDFGIDFALYNNVHPTCGLPWNHPYAMFDRKVQGCCSAVLMTSPQIFLDVDGMDPSMAYLCCDTDYGIKLKEKGLETWVVADSLVYHKGASSKRNTKNMLYSYLASDARAMFYAKKYDVLEKLLPSWLATVFEIYLTTHKIMKKYIMVSLSSYTSAEWFINVIKETLQIDYYTVYSYNPMERKSINLQLYDYVSLSLIDCPVPIIYFVDDIKCLRGNALWRKLRDVSSDIVIDINGSIIEFKEYEYLYSRAVEEPIRR